MVVRPPVEIATAVLKTDPKRKPVDFKMPQTLDISDDPAALPPGEYITNHRCNDPSEWDIQKAPVLCIYCRRASIQKSTYAP